MGSHVEGKPQGLRSQRPPSGSPKVSADREMVGPLLVWAHVARGR